MTAATRWAIAGVIALFALILLGLYLTTKPLPAPPFTMIDSSGRSVSLNQFRGKVVAIGFFSPHCGKPDLCALLGQSFRATQQQLNQAGYRSRYELLTVDLVPNASPSALRAFARELGANAENWQFVSAPRRPLVRTLIAYGTLKKGQTDPAQSIAMTAIVGVHGHLLGQYVGAASDGQIYIVKAIKSALGVQ